MEKRRQQYPVQERDTAICRVLLCREGWLGTAGAVMIISHLFAFLQRGFSQKGVTSAPWVKTQVAIMLCLKQSAGVIRG